MERFIWMEIAYEEAEKEAREVNRLIDSVKEAFRRAQGEGVEWIWGTKYVRKDSLVKVLREMGLSKDEARRAVKEAESAGVIAETEEYYVLG
ncbi:MAG TPA: hypothetical protein EYP17_09520 [Candidatus Latescibacteria bacterium]|nr:hypothetical protein [Candidatus Latescibacterota bacterium]